MGNGYSILIWDDWGAGLVMINPRFFTAGFDMYGNPCNWFPCEELPTEEEVRKAHNLQFEKHVRVIA